MRRCAFGCKTDGRVIHSFPHPDKFPEQFKNWVDLVGGTLKTSSDYNKYRKKKICEIHFTDDCRNRNKRLNALAVPSLHLPKRSGPLESDSIPAAADLDKTNGNPAVDVWTDHSYSALSWFKQVASFKGKESDVSEETPSTSAINGNTAPNANEVADDTVEIADDGCDDIVDSPMLGDGLSLFSWQKTPYSADDVEVLSNTDSEVNEVPFKLEPDETEVSMYLEDENSGSKFTYRCNECGAAVTGFRYTCVQCADWDLCSACEAHEAHAAHYVLRVPSPRPYEEIQAVLAAIRQQLLSENLFLHGINDSVKLEVKDDPEQVPKPATGFDPLGNWDSALQDYVNTIDIAEENESDADHPPPRKRPRPSPVLAHDRENSPTTPAPTNIPKPAPARKAIPKPAPTDDTPTTLGLDSARSLPKTEKEYFARRLQRDKIRRILSHTSTRPTARTQPHHSPTRSQRTDHYPKADTICRNRTPLLVTKGKAIKLPRSNLKGNSRRVLVRVSPGTNPMDCIQTLRSKVSVRLERLPAEWIAQSASKNSSPSRHVRTYGTRLRSSETVPKD